jgi:hypothetical protein
LDCHIRARIWEHGRAWNLSEMRSPR